MIRIPDNLSSAMTVFCDFDGPLVDVSDRYYSTYRLALSQVQQDCEDPSTMLTPLSKKEFWQMKQERVPDIEIAKYSGLPVEVIDFFLSQVSQIVNHADLLGQDILQPGVAWALQLMHSEQVQIVLVTLRAQQQAQQILQEAHLDHLFSGIYGTHGGVEVAYQNSIELKTQLLKQAATIHWPHHLRPHHPSWMIGDTEADIWAGRNLGIPTIALTCGIRSHQYLQKQSPTLILSDLVSTTHHLLGCRVSCASA